jgi:hypothetical protein
LDLPWLWEYEESRILWIEHIFDDPQTLENKVRKSLLDRIRLLETFDRMLKDNGDGDFCIIDDVEASDKESRRHKIYRGPDGVDTYVTVDSRPGPDLSGDEVFLAPWHRLIFCKGLSTVVKPDRPLFDDYAILT